MALRSYAWQQNVNFPNRLGVRIIIYAVITIAAELTIYGIYMSTGDGYGLWFFILENLNVLLFPRIYTWQNWTTWGMLGMFLFVTIVGEIIYRMTKRLIHSKESILRRE
jgi:hypothetical protein